MRQVGIIAAGALYALEHHRKRLAEDHANARKLAAGLAEIPGIEMDPASVQSNMVIFRLSKAPVDNVVSRLQEEGVLVLVSRPDRIRAVTHLNVSSKHIELAIGIFESVLKHI